MKNKIAEILKHDKLIHFFVGFFLYVGFSLFFDNLTSYLITAFFAVINELRDEYIKKGSFSWLDIVFTIAPALILSI